MNKLPPGKTRAELDRDYEDLQAKVADDMRVLGAYQKRNHRIDRGDCFVLGLLIGMAAMAIIIGLSQRFFP